MGLVCWAHISSAIQHALAETTDSLAQPLLRYCFKVFCNVQSGECIFTCELYSQDVPGLGAVLSAQIPVQKTMANLVMLKLVGKMHKVQQQNLYKFGSHSSPNTIRLEASQVQENTTSGNWAQTLPAVQAGTGQPHRTKPDQILRTDRTTQGPARPTRIIPEDHRTTL
jgi:hypothetical protein